jgi:hypothetical protein
MMYKVYAAGVGPGWFASWAKPGYFSLSNPLAETSGPSDYSADS